jgi:hypothetical protein
MVRPFLSVQPRHKLTVSTSPASIPLFILVSAAPLHPHLSVRAALPPSYFWVRSCTRCVHLLCQSHHTLTTPTSYACSPRFFPLLNHYRIACASRARGAFLLGCYLGSNHRVPSIARLSRRFLHECAYRHYLSNRDCCSWRDLCINHIRCVLYAVFHNPRIPAFVHVPPFFEPADRAARNGTATARPNPRMPMAANVDHGVPFGTSPSLWLSAALPFNIFPKPLPLRAVHPRRSRRSIAIHFIRLCPRK